MRYVALVFVALLAVATVVVPEPGSPAPDAPPPSTAAPFAVCPLGEAARRTTTVVVAGSAPGAAEMAVFSSGEIVASETSEIGPGGVAVQDVGELTGLALAPVLVALPQAAPIGSVLGEQGRAATACSPGSPDTVTLPGGLTTEGESFEVRLANPFAGSATASLIVASEVGTESDPALEEVIVPPSGVVTVDLAGLLPGRLGMSVAVTSVDGQVVASALQAGGGDTAAWQGVEPAIDWYVPVPNPNGVDTSLVLTAPGSSEVAYQLDVYARDGLVQAAAEGTVPARGHAVVPISDILEGPGAIRVVAAAPVGASLRLEGEGVRAVYPGATAPQASWFLPGAGVLGQTRVLVFNPTDVDVAAQIASADGSEVFDSVVFPPGQMTGVTIPGGTAGLRLDGDGDLVVAWFNRGDDGFAADIGQPATGTSPPIDVAPPPTTTSTTTTSTTSTTTTSTTVPGTTSTTAPSDTTTSGSPTTTAP